MVARVRMLIMAGVAGLFPVTYALGVVRLTGLALWHAHLYNRDIQWDSRFGGTNLRLILTALAQGGASFLMLRQPITPAIKQDAWQIMMPAGQPEFFQLLQLVTD